MSERINRITLDESSIKHRTLEVEHERAVAVADLLGDNLFEPAGMSIGTMAPRASARLDRIRNRKRG